MSGKTIKETTNSMFEEVIIEKTLADEVELLPSLIDMYARRFAEERDELIYSLFEECGYHREEVLDLIRDGIITGTASSSVVYPDMNWYTFSAHGETLFIMNEVFNPVTNNVTLSYQVVKGDEDV